MTRQVDYDAVAGEYDRRYREHDSGGVERTLRAFVGGEGATPPPRVLEVGCGTGHWLAALAGQVAALAGLDPSWGMLARARAAAPHARLARGRGEALPYRTASFDRVYCINVYHHLADAPAFVAEAHRVLRPGGGLLVVGLDPHAGGDRWWIYDYFPGAREADLARYPAAPVIRAAMARAGFDRCETSEAQHIPARVPVAAAEARGLLDRRSTSQLMVIGDDAFREGSERIRAAAAEAAARGAEMMLEADLRLYATTAWRAG